MSQASPPEITFELDGGSLTIRTSDAVYHIVVTGAATAPAALPQGSEAVGQLPAVDEWDVPEPVTADKPAPTYKPQKDDGYYKELSQEMYHEVGQLAKRLSMSISDVKGAKVDSMDLQAAGDQLESAKDQLESVVEMTEKATLTIIEESESIQSAIDRVRSIMAEMSSGAQDGEENEDGPSRQNREALEEILETLAQYLEAVRQTPLDDVVVEVHAIAGELGQAKGAAEPEPEPEPAATGYSFPLELVFQTTYELCTNETVKKHLKAMWDAGAKAFDPAKVEAGLNKLAPAEPDEDNFLNVDLKGVLKVLFQSTKVDSYKGILKKMASTADQIFLDQFLPMEAVPAEAPAAAPKPKAAPAPAPAAGGAAAELAERLEALVQKLEERAAALKPPELPGDLKDLLQRALDEASQDRARVTPEKLQELDENMNRVISSVNAIIEALSFQDLSGQAIYRIVRLLTDFQVQLLAMLVSFGSKIKTKETREEITPDESEKLAQQEVDKALESLGLSDPEAGGDKEEERGPLDQDAVNAMLESLGF